MLWVTVPLHEQQRTKKCVAMYKNCFYNFKTALYSSAVVMKGFTSYGVRECNTSLCQSNVCMNGSSCQDGGSNFFCDCQFPFTCPLCAIYTINPCDHTLLCASGATCVDAANGVDYSCTCLDGALRERCSQSEMTMNLISYLPKINFSLSI